MKYLISFRRLKKICDCGIHNYETGKFITIGCKMTDKKCTEKNCPILKKCEKEESILKNVWKRIDSVIQDGYWGNDERNGLILACNIISDLITEKENMQ